MTVSRTDYEFLKELMRDHIAHRLDDGKDYLIESRLGPVARDLGLTGVGELLREVRRGTAQLRSTVVEAMTINETSFFRDPQVYAALRDVVIPELLRDGPRRLIFWSAAAASGQEAYSLAMLMRDDFPNVLPPTILATDVSAGALRRARDGRYTQLEVNRGLPARALTRHFTHEGRDWRISPELREMVEFRQLNLAGPWPNIPPADLILMRNVLIYLHDDARVRVLHRAAEMLRPGGYLLLGSAENTMNSMPPLDSIVVGRTVIRHRTRSGERATDGVR